MLWFRHEATAHRDPRLVELGDEFGPGGIAFWWQLNEACCLEDGPITFPEGNYRRAAKVLGIDPEWKIPLAKVIAFCVDLKLIRQTKSHTLVSLEPTNRIKYLAPKSQTAEAQRERKRRSRAKLSRQSHSDTSQNGHGDGSRDVTPYETKRDVTKQMIPTGSAKPVVALAAKHLESIKPKIASGNGFDLLHEFKQAWPAAWQEAIDTNVNPKAVGIQLIGKFVASVTDSEPDYGRAGQLVGRFGKLSLLGIDEGIMANADDPYKYAFRVCQNKASESRAGAS